MQSKLLSRTAAGALLAAAALSLGAAARAQTAEEAAAGGVNSDNGVHAVPSGHVAVARLDVMPRSGGAGAAAKAVHLQHAYATRSRSQGGHLQHAALARSAHARPVIQVASRDRLTRARPETSVLPPVVIIKATAEPAPAPSTPLFELARAEVGLRPLMTVAALDAPRELTSFPAPEPDIVEEASEEAAVYGQPVQEARADTVADLAGAPQASLLLVRNEQARPALVVGEPDPGIRQHVAFPRRSAEAAAAFDHYMHAVAGIDAGFRSGSGVAAALKTASAYNPLQLEEGMVAYGALAALQSQRFVYAVMDAAADADGRQALIQTLLDDPQTVQRLRGADEAARMASAAILHEARPVVASGRSLRQAAYDVQHQAWSTLRASDQPGRLAQAKSASAGRIIAADSDMARLVSQVSTGVLDEDVGRGASPVTARSLALAALAILDGAGGGEDGRLTPILSETISADCLRLAKLNLFQCLSVAGPEYEDVYCLGQHAVLDTGQCVSGATGVADVALLFPRPEALK